MHPFSGLFLDADVKTVFIKNPLHNIFGHTSSTRKKKQRSVASSISWEVLSNMLFFSVNWKEKWKKGLCSMSCHFLAWKKKEFSGIFICGERSACSPFYFQWPPTLINVSVLHTSFYFSKNFQLLIMLGQPSWHRLL